MLLMVQLSRNLSSSSTPMGDELEELGQASSHQLRRLVKLDQVMTLKQLCQADSHDSYWRQPNGQSSFSAQIGSLSASPWKYS